MRQKHINIHIKTIAVEHREHIKTIKTQKSNTTQYYDNFIWYIDTEIEQWTIFNANKKYVLWNMVSAP